ncbi:hypothetical protein, conserved [Babesia bigemina]|uniref:C3H1-type domain-containing protein n=1 Tax=Babesia bigemina TaxID=5866 RepID=A0A061BPG7_BABBI|nr:hypothetical protein, conserved [Babesia bigemina]CDR71405.1 hypothetical protein, conserved [Babesia bigemina]|eukprot:XP_012770355.1 hypothetical protein, conserved [Babesia bigemina]
MSSFTSLLTVSIDWLIQVRYANGGNGDGLTKLSQALKKLIEEAIGNATKSLQSEKKKLSCPFKYSDTETYCQYYEKQIKHCEEELNKLQSQQPKKPNNEYEKNLLTSTKQRCDDAKKACIKAHQKHPPSAALKSVDSKIVQLGELAGQLGAFVGESDVVKKAVENAIIAVINSNEELKKLYSPYVTKLSESVNSGGKADDTGEIGQLQVEVSRKITEITNQIKQLKQQNKLNNNSLPSPSPSAELAKLQSKLDALKKVEELCENYEKLKTMPNEPKNLLENLCDGLQTFLGFNKDSKGYDGTGIVYSDLDRLCDGVMGFLSGVLSAVKDDEAVKTYDNMMSNKLEKVLEEVNKKIGTGRDGLAASVGALKGWLGKYLLELGKRTSTVTGHLGTLCDEIERTHIKSVSMKKDRKLEEQLQDWKNIIQIIEQHINNINTEHVNKLDNTLKNNVMREIEPIINVVKHLKDVSADDVLRCQAVKVDNELLKQKNILEAAIHMNSDDVQKTLRNGIDEVVNHINTLNDKRKQQIQYLDGVIATADQQAQILLDEYRNKYTNGIDGMFADLHGSIKDIEANKAGVENDDNSRCPLEKQIEVVKKAVESIEEAYKSRLKKVKTAVDSAVGTTRGTIRGLGLGLIRDLRSLKKKVEQYIKAYVKGLKEAGMEKLEWKVKNDLRILNSCIYTKVTEYIEADMGLDIKNALKAMTDKISGGDTENGPLDLIEVGVAKYVDKFTQKNFGNQILEQWLKQILQSKQVKTSLWYYASDDWHQQSDPYKNNGTSEQAIAQAIVKQLTEEMQAATRLVTDREVSVTQNLNNIRSCLTTFAQKIQNRIMRNDLGEIASNILGAVDSNVKKTSSKEASHLIPAVDIIFQQLHGMAKQVSDAVEMLLRDCTFNNVDGAILAVEGLPEDLKNEVANKGNVKPNTLGDTIKKTLETKVKVAIGMGGWDSDIKLGENRLMDEFISAYEKLLKAFETKDLDSKIEVLFKGLRLGEDEKFKDLMTTYAGENGISKVCSQIDAMEQAVSTEGFQLAKNGAADFNPDDMSGYNDVGTGAKRTYLAAVETVKTTIDNLENIPGFVEDKRKAACSKMEELRQKIEGIQGRIYGVKLAVSHANDALSAAINAVSEALIIASKNAMNAIESLRVSLIGKVTEALDDVTEQVQKLFAEQHVVELATLQKLAEEQKSRIVTIIKKDETTVIKGLIKTMVDQHATLDKMITDVASYSPENFNAAVSKTKDYLNRVLVYIWKDIQKGLASHAPQRERYRTYVEHIKQAINDMLDRIYTSKHFDDEFVQLRGKLDGFLQNLSPRDYGAMAYAVMDALKHGLIGLTHELDKAYVNTYSGKQYADADNAKYAKVCFTALSILKKILSELRKRSGKKSEHDGFKDQQIRKYTALGTLLGDEGFVVSDPDEQNGELQDKRTMTGEQIKGLIIGTADEHVYTSLDDVRDGGSLKALYECLETYFRVTHINPPQKPKAPCSVYETLCWFSSFPYTPVYLDLTSDGFGELIGKTDKAGSKDTGDDFITFEDFGSQSKDAYPEAITVGHLSDCLTEVCHYSHDLLTTIQGHGHAGGIYACDFNVNPHGLVYPSDMNSLLCLLFELLKRLHYQLYVLYQQCSYESDLGGWRDCWYGQGIYGSAWKCNALQCPNQDCDQSCNQTANQKCRQIPKCGVKSPLQSFLEDGLQGYLPHSLKSERGQIKCSLSGHSGIPCATPMGFADIETVASRRLTGDSLTNVLAEMCGDESSPLSKLCAHMNCLLASAPKALGEMFGFYLNFLGGWNDINDNKGQVHKRNAFETAVRAANFENEATDLDITPIFRHRGHGSGKNVKHLTGDLYSLVHCNGNPSSVASHPCGPYLRPICQDTCNTYTEKDADKYLSWIVYLTETFYDLLKKLYEECSANCDSKGSRCRTSKCKPNCTASSRPAGDGSAHTEDCNSIVQCKKMRPTLLKYGFVHGDCTTLSTTPTKRTCKDMCMVLKSVVIGECKLGDLVYVTIPEFLFTIRAPFIWLNVALWLLSFLYLLHIMVIRLDLLHIKSHLHSPSSHRIAAQSLLAAARVNKLNRVFYLQP